MESSTLMFKDPFCSLAHLHLISSSLAYSFPNLSIVTFHCRFYIPRFCCSIPPFPHYPPPQHKAVRVLGIQWAVKSYKLLLLCVWPSNRGGRDREKEREILCFNTSEPESPTSPSPPSLPLPPLIHSDTDKHTHSCKTATHYNPNTFPPAHIHTQSTAPLLPIIITSSEHVTAQQQCPRHRRVKDTSTTLLQRVGHFTEVLNKILQSSRGIKALLDPEKSSFCHLYMMEQCSTHCTPSPQAHRPETCQKTGERSPRCML